MAIQVVVFIAVMSGSIYSLHPIFETCSIHDMHEKTPTVARAMIAMITAVVVHGTFALATFGNLPDKIPVHFGADGVADSFAEPSVCSWFGLFFVSVGTGLLMGTIALSVFKIPSRYLSIPRKKEYLALGEHPRNRLMGVIATHTLIMGIASVVLMLCVHISMALLAHGSIDRFPAWIVFAAMLVIIIELVVMITSFLRKLDNEIRRMK